MENFVTLIGITLSKIIHSVNISSETEYEEPPCSSQHHNRGRVASTYNAEKSKRGIK